MDYLIIGAGLSGSVIARQLAETGSRVTIWERRNHIGGNMYDSRDAYGILIHNYGPHTFHTNDPILFDYICRFGSWQPYQLICGTEIDGKFTPTPFNFTTIDMLYDKDEAILLKRRLSDIFGDKETATVLEVMSSDDYFVRSYGELLFVKDYRPYTVKQWGIPPEKIDASVFKRVPLRFSYNERYFDDEYQVIPKISYNEFFHNLLNHPLITVKLNIDALKRLTISDDGEILYLDNEPCNVPVIYTGPLDELFHFAEGRLPYRSLNFEWHHENVNSIQPYAVTAYPQVKDYTRITEYNKLLLQKTTGTTYAKEYSLAYTPGQGMEPYYPVLTTESQKQYARYRQRIEKLNDFYVCGRLADFKYYNMDQALARALTLTDTIIHRQIRKRSK